MVQLIEQSSLVPYKIYHAFDRATSFVPAGHVLLSLRWRITKEAKEAGAKSIPTCVVAVAATSLFVEPASLNEIIHAAFHDAREACARDYVNSRIADETGINLESILIPADILSDAGMATWHAASLVKKDTTRLSKDLLSAWFDALLAPAIRGEINRRMPGVVGVMMTATLAAYKGHIIALSKRDTALGETLARQVQEVVHLVDINDPVRAAVSARLDGFISPKTDALLLSLAPPVLVPAALASAASPSAIDVAVE